jgi:hypothetical protein
MQTIQSDYFAAYRGIQLVRDADGVLVVEFHSNGEPCTFSALHPTELSTPFTASRKTARTRS